MFRTPIDYKKRPAFDTLSILEYRTEPKPDEYNAEMHVILLTGHDALGIDNQLLVGEVMVLAQAIINRINQKDLFFEYQSFSGWFLFKILHTSVMFVNFLFSFLSLLRFNGY